MKTIVTKISTGVLGLFLGMLLLQGCFPAGQVSSSNDVVPPSWAPQYDDVGDVHYYYLPDLEMYYDVWNHEYVYLQDGSWVFSAGLPPYYSDYDLNNAYVVMLDARVHQPWMHHQLYASHYPRYFYRSANNRYISGDRRWFDENRPRGINTRSANGTSSRTYPQQKPDQQAERNVQRNTNVNNSNNNTTNHRNDNPSTRTYDNPATNHNPVNTQVQNNHPQNNGDNRRSQPAVYSGKQVGQPVRVKRNMMAPKQTKSTTTGNNQGNNEHSEGSGGGRR